VLKLARGQLEVAIRGLFPDLSEAWSCEDTSIFQQVWEMADDQMSWKVDHVTDLTVAGSVTRLAAWPCVVTSWFCHPVVTVLSVQTT